MKGNALVIGASGGIGAELVRQLHNSDTYYQVHAVSRSIPLGAIDGVYYHQVASQDETQIADFCAQLKSDDVQFTTIVCCIGALHGSNGENPVTPEKRLEDVNKGTLDFYFATNVIIPAIWLKHAAGLLKGKQDAKLVFLSARVGSIQDNELGGWYGYRASKAALNMLLKSAQVELKRRAKNISVVSYHPGTVDTDLSKPFQANIPKERLFSAEFTVQKLLSLISELSVEDAPYFLDWQGKPIPW